MRSNYTTIFYGPLGRKKMPVIGGGETGNHRTLHLLERQNFNVKTISKPYPVKTCLGCVAYILRLVFIPFHFAFALIAHPSIKTVHISGFYLHLIYQEFFLVLVSRLFRKRCIYELRGGGVKEAYQHRTFVYKLFFAGTVKNASIVLCQGKIYIDFLRSKTNAKILHYPNYILDNDFPPNKGEERNESAVVHIVYFGRIVRSKNLEFLLSVASELQSDRFGFDLEIIGDGDPAYFRSLTEKINALKLQNLVTVHGPLPASQIMKMLLTKHFFLFPSCENREGHSNALTEAMAMGVVPLCSKAGFNEEIVGNKKLCFSFFNAKNYARCIQNIWNNKEWMTLSSEVAKRIRTTYTEKQAMLVLSEAYEISTAYAHPDHSFPAPATRIQ